MQRVKGMKEKTAAKLSGEGLTVNGQGFKGASARPAKSEAKPSKPAVAAVAK
jgi:competence protein ComEA